MGVKRESFLFHIHLSVVSSFDMQGCAQAGVKMEKNERHEVPAEELDSLASRFLLIIPERCQGDRARVGFQLEKAYWAHLNQFKKDKARSIKKRFTLKDFSLQIFPNVPFLRDHVDIVGDVIDDFKEYKSCVPTFGVILLNETMDKVVLVRSSWGKRWNLPKGMVNEKESGHDCAARVAQMDLGVNVGSLLDPDIWIEEVGFESYVASVNFLFFS